MSLHPLSIMFIAGDVSGDHHAAPVVRRLLLDYPGSRTWGIGGPQMQAQGFEAVMPFQPFNKMGFAEVLRSLPFFLQARKNLIKEMIKRKPDCLFCVDYPGFNMILMKDAHKLGIPVIWYIAPMVWAWKKNRAQVLARHASFIGCIFPFEVQYFSPFTSRVDFVGNPLIEVMEKENYQAAPPKKGLHLAIVPGSRWQEVRKTLVPMVETFRILKSKFPGLRGSISLCAGLPTGFYENTSKDTDLLIVQKPLRTLLAEADLALVTSGTATLEAALLGVPMVVAYKTSWLNYTVFKNVLKIPFISLPNIIAGEKIVPECIQDQMTPSIMADKLAGFIIDETVAGSARKQLCGIRDLLGSKKPSVQLSLILRKILDSNSAAKQSEDPPRQKSSVSPFC